MVGCFPKNENKVSLRKCIAQAVLNQNPLILKNLFMIAKIFLSLTDYPIFRRIMWKPIYQWLAKKFDFDEWNFMNYGYCPFEYEKKLKLDADHEVHRFSIQLYHYLSTKVRIEGMDVLEIGSGRRGGCNYIKRYLNPRKITGLDIAD